MILVDSPEKLRPWLLGFVESLNSHTAMTGPNKGGRLAKNSRRGPLVTVEAFYRWMYDNRAEAASVLGDRRWTGLGLQHTVLFRLEDKPRLTNRFRDGLHMTIRQRPTRGRGHIRPEIPVTGCVRRPAAREHGSSRKLRGP
ncbi:hypothetical protein [Nonomuraea sp. NPDC049400]|uniref:hypothetical protein n=1 Tax=Nonomuraea sp. NPDC049400 TaxID=3364352 RepID=UPI00379769EE